MVSSTVNIDGWNLRPTHSEKVLEFQIHFSTICLPTPSDPDDDFFDV